MTNTYKALIVLGLGLMAVLATAFVAHANPLRFPPAVSFATATTSVSYFTTATATTTLAVYDSYSNTGVVGAGGSTQAMDKASLLIQFAASSTSSILRAKLEYSQDGVDWYGDNIIVPASGYNSISIDNVYTWTAGGTATSSKLVNVPTPLRYVRATFAVSGANGAIWASIQPQKQSQ